MSSANVTEETIAALFDRWNESLKTGDPKKVVANYAQRSILLPTISNQPRLTPEEKEDYFSVFLQTKPSAVINLSQITINGDMAVDSGIYTFTLAAKGETLKVRYSFVYQWDGEQWLIVSHHSSAMPEG